LSSATNLSKLSVLLNTSSKIDSNSSVDSENYDDILKRMNPQLSFAVENSMSDDETEMAVDLSFESLSDFSPASIVKQVEPLQALMETRNKLRDLLTKVDRSDELESILEDVLSNTDNLELWIHSF
jgi:type VI secretion system protein ImpB